MAESDVNRLGTYVVPHLELEAALEGLVNSLREALADGGVVTDVTSEFRVTGDGPYVLDARMEAVREGDGLRIRFDLTRGGS